MLAVKNKLLIIGAGGHGKVIADIAMKMKQWNSILFLDDDENINNPMGIKVIGKSTDVYKYVKDCDIFVAVGNNVLREKIQTKLMAVGASIPVLVHPTAIIGEQVEYGAGTAIMAGVIINCCTKIGKGCIINTGTTIDHDNIIEDYVHISPGVNTAGTVTIGKGTWLGIGSVVSNNLNITSGCKIGAGAVVINDIMEAGTYAGVPVRRVG